MYIQYVCVIYLMNMHNFVTMYDFTNIAFLKVFYSIFFFSLKLPSSFMDPFKAQSFPGAASPSQPESITQHY